MIKASSLMKYSSLLIPLTVLLYQGEVLRGLLLDQGSCSQPCLDIVSTVENIIMMEVIYNRYHHYKETDCGSKVNEFDNVEVSRMCSRYANWRKWKMRK